jgi:adenylate cyclase
MKEIECKFLVINDDYKKGLKPVHVLQAYLFREEDAHMRVRIVDGKSACISLKKHISGFSRWEYEYSIPVDEAEQIIRYFAKNRIVEKKRYFPVFGGKRWDVDEFLEENKGLVIAEIELDSEEQVFDKPPWAGEEVTHDPRYLNVNLAVHPYSEW